MSTLSVDVGDNKNPAIVILATPTFATWLENRVFMCKILEAIFATRPGAARAPNSDVTALAAVVDGLPPGKHGQVELITEGFAFLPCDHRIVLPELWQRDDNDPACNQWIHPRPSIIFKICRNSGIERGLEIGVPLANTLFRNGRTSTLFASKWNRTDATDTFERIQQVEKKSATIYPASSNPIVPLHLEIPLVPLTPPRRVVSGLGNIIRQVANAEGNVVSASQELEASVNSYLETKSLNKQTVTVWALIIPDSIIMDRTSEGIPAADPKQIRASWTDTPDSSMRSYVGNWLRQGRGATLHRVCMYTFFLRDYQVAYHELKGTVSGGGGWGLKQGLLSLDPETTLLNSADTSHDFDLSDSVDNDQIQALGNIAKPGSWVQFLISYNLMSSRPIGTVDVGTVEPGFESASNLSFGCIASTVDDMPQPSSDPSVPSNDNNHRYSVSGFYGHFGAMSEGGIFIRATENGVVTSSKIDVPNSEFRLAVINRKES